MKGIRSAHARHVVDITVTADKVDDADATVLVFFIDEPKLRTESARNVISVSAIINE